MAWDLYLHYVLCILCNIRNFSETEYSIMPLPEELVDNL
jgi:hypothetical protein